MEIPKDAKRIHLYDVNNILRPRGTLQKESLSLTILERLNNSYESWNDIKYADTPTQQELIKILRKNFVEECEEAWKQFIKNKIIERS